MLVLTVSADTNSIWFKNIIARRIVTVKIESGILKPVILRLSLDLPKVNGYCR